MRIELAIKTEGSDDGYVIRATMTEKEMRSLIEDADVPEAKGCGCAVCQFAEGLKDIAAKIDQP